MLANITGHLSSFDLNVDDTASTCMDLVGEEINSAINSVFDFSSAPRFRFGLFFGIFSSFMLAY
jgi:hypothetical protein